VVFDVFRSVAAAEGELVGFELMARPTVGGQGMDADGGSAESQETRSVTFALQSVSGLLASADRP
jgi:hypothetical protein